MVKISKRTFLLSMILFCVASPVVCSVFGAGMLNQPIGKTSEPLNMVESYRFDEHYGTHDWIFDYALKIIDSSPGYRGYINTWLFDVNQGTKMGYLEVIGTPGSWFNDNEDHSRNYRNNRYFLGSTDQEKDKQWIFARRFVTALHHTSFPDRTSGKCIINAPQLPAETGSTSISVRGSSHQAEVIYDDLWQDDFRVNLNSPGLKYVDKCAMSAMAALKGQSEFYTDESGNQALRYGKFELAAALLGEIGHYFGDMANPAHFLSDWDDPMVPDIDARPWSNFVQSGCFTSWVSDPEIDSYPSSDPINSRRVIGGPDICEVVEIIVEEELDDLDLTLTHMMSPSTCAGLMALSTYTAYDVDELDPPELGELAAPNILDDFDDESVYVQTTQIEDRARQLVANAVYYLACSILYILAKCNTNDMTKVHMKDNYNIAVRDPDPSKYGGGDEDLPPKSNNKNLMALSSIYTILKEAYPDWSEEQTSFMASLYYFLWETGQGSFSMGAIGSLSMLLALAPAFLFVLAPTVPWVMAENWKAFAQMLRGQSLLGGGGIPGDVGT